MFDAFSFDSLFAFARTLPPELFVLLSLGVGYALGNLRIGPVKPGGVCGTLVAALVIGQAEIAVDPGVKSFFFAVFIFALGYAGGPQFFANLNAKGLRLGLLSVIEFVGVAVLALAAARIFGFDPGTTAGLVAGSATESAVIGTASEAIARLPLPADAVKLLQANVVTAYSICYVFGLITIVLFTSQAAPLLLRVNLSEAAENLWRSMGGGKQEEAGAEAAVPDAEGRAFRVTLAAGRTADEMRSLLGGTAGVEKVRRRGENIAVSGETILHRNDIVLLMGGRDALMRAGAVLGPELIGAPFMNMGVETEEFVFNGRAGSGTLADLSAAARASGRADGVYLAGVRRGGMDMPLVPDLRLTAGDVVRLYGLPEAVRDFGARVGARVRGTGRSNIIYIGLGIVLGILIGRIGIAVGGVDLALGTGGGALLTGLLFGWFQNRHPAISPTPAAALEIMKDLGLATFVACVGLSSGKQAAVLVMQYGVTLPLVGVCISLTPALISLFVGRYLLKLDVPVLLGGIAGQQCSTPALSAVQAAAGNTTPLIGYTITYAVSNILLPLLGPVIVALAAALQAAP